jgi:hypothetical protein
MPATPKEQGIATNKLVFLYFPATFERRALLGEL